MYFSRALASLQGQPRKSYKYYSDTHLASKAVFTVLARHQREHTVFVKLPRQNSRKVPVPKYKVKTLLSDT